MFKPKFHWYEFGSLWCVYLVKKVFASVAAHWSETESKSAHFLNVIKIDQTISIHILFMAKRQLH